MPSFGQSKPKTPTKQPWEASGPSMLDEAVKQVGMSPVLPQAKERLAVELPPPAPDDHPTGRVTGVKGYDRQHKTYTQEEILAAIEAIGGYHTGDCGAFALALANVLGPEHCTLVISDTGEGTFIGHVAVQYGGTIYDGDGITTEDSVLGFVDVDEEDDEAGEPQLVQVKASSANPGEIMKFTNPSHGVSYYQDLLAKAFTAQ